MLARSIVRGLPRWFRLTALIGLVLILILLIAACAGNQAVATPDATEPTDRGSERIVVGCDETAGEVPRPRAGRVLFDRIALPPKRFPERPRYQPEEHHPLPYFAKQGVLVRSGQTPVDLIVPRAWHARLAIAWGSDDTDQQVPAVRFLGCDRGDVWLAYAGGFPP